MEKGLKLVIQCLRKRGYIYVKNFITPAEEILVRKGNSFLATEFRTTIIESLSEEILQETSGVLETNFDTIYQDWDYDRNTGILLLINKSNDVDQEVDESVGDNLFKLIRVVASKLHKLPTGCRIVKFSYSACAVESKGVILPLEYPLSEKKYSEALYFHNREVKKGYLEHKYLFEEFFNRSILDLFIIWDYKENKNYIIFSLGKV